MDRRPMRSSDWLVESILKWAGILANLFRSIFDYAGRMLVMTNWSDYAGKTGARVKTMKTWQDFTGDAGSATTTWNYDANNGFLTNKVYQDGHGPAYTYTSAGRLQTRTWARGVVTTYGYDPAGALNSINYSDATPGVSNNYDRQGRLLQSTGLGSRSYAWNDAGELVKDNYTVASLSYSSSLKFGYDVLLRRSFLKNFTLGTVDNYSYDAASRLASVADGVNVVSYGYLTNSTLVSQIVFKQGTTTRMTTTKQSDYLNRVKQISSVPSAAGVMPLSYNYNYNSANQRTKNTLADGSFWEYQYDTLGQVTNGVKHFADGTLVPGQSFGYLFDDIGNRQQTMIGGGTNGMRVASYGVNNLNQITNRGYPGTNDIIGVALVGNGVSVNGNTNVFRKKEYFSAVVGTNNTSSPAWLGVTVASGGKTNTGNLYFPKTPEIFSYDSDGNRITDGRFNYQWDAENRITQFERPDTAPTAARGKVDCQYDYRFRRTQKIVSTWSGSNYVAQSTNRFLYDGWNLVAIMNATNGPDRSFIWGTDLSGSMQGAGGVGGLISMTLHQGTNAGTYLYCYDGNGNVAALVNAANGEIAARYEYDPFLAILRATGPLAYLNPFLGSTKFYDWETGLYYYGYRYYDPLTGTWPSRDPVEEDGGENLYSFVYGDSVNSFDELGLRRRSGNQNRNRDRGWNLDLFDARGQDILKWWLDGSGQRRDLSDGIWGDYMMANETLRQQLKNKMEQDAISRISSGAVNLQFHAEIENGYLTGYEMLHGTHRGVGDFTVKGNAGVSGTTCRTVDYKVTYVWHDIIDPNATYSSDNLAAWVLKLFYKPKDYEIHISWSQPSRVELSSKIINKETGYPFEKK